tara:strand:+ start:1404 stop:1979 length:576 start_codon:yes stop_codon:yes gene_type:complete
MLKELLCQSAGVSDLPQWEHAQRSLQSISVKKDEAVFHQGVPHGFVYGVRQGLVKLQYLDEEGGEWIKSFAQEGRFFASLSALSPLGQTSFMVTAVEPTELERLDYADLAQLADRHLSWAKALWQLTKAYAARKESRERELLTRTAEMRYRTFVTQEPELAQRIPQKDMARYLGVTPVGLNRIAMRIRKHG